MIKADLAVAGVPYKDADDRYADFHALRHTFISNLARAGVHPRNAQALARHSTIDLTMNVYTHVAIPVYLMVILNTVEMAMAANVELSCADAKSQTACFQKSVASRPRGRLTYGCLTRGLVVEAKFEYKRH